MQQEDLKLDLENIRLRLGVSRHVMGRALDITPNRVKHIEVVGNRYVRLFDVLNLANLLNISVEDLLFGKISQANIDYAKEVINARKRK